MEIHEKRGMWIVTVGPEKRVFDNEADAIKYAKGHHVEEPDEDELLKRLLAEEQETADHGSDTTESLESSLSAEEELLLLEEMEDSPTQQEKENDGADLSDVPEDIWSIHRAGLGQDQKGVIRFAEDIEDLG